MTSLYGLEGLRTLAGERRRELIEEANQERQARRARRPVTPPELPEAQLRTAGRTPEIEWGPWLQGGEPLHLSKAGHGLS